MWELDHKEGWAPKIDAFELWWRRLLRVPWTARRSNQSILKEISPEYLLEGLMLKLQYYGHLIRRPNSLEKTLMLGKTDGRRRRGWQRMRWLDGNTNFNGHELEQTAGDGEGQGSLVCCSPRGHKELDTTEQLKNKFGNQIYIQKFSFKVTVLINVNTSHILRWGKTIKPDIAENKSPVTSLKSFTVICLATLPEAHSTSTFLFLYGSHLDCLM